MPTQLDRGTGHARRRGWAVVATFKDDGYSAFKEVTRDGFGELIAAIVNTVLDALSAPAGAEDTRTHEQRYHDALQEAMRSL